MKYEHIPDGAEVTTKVRYRDPGTLSTVLNVEDKIKVEFLANVRGVAPGQSSVFYEGEDVVGGGIIYNSILD